MLCFMYVIPTIIAAFVSFRILCILIFRSCRLGSGESWWPVLAEHGSAAMEVTLKLF